jgi:hypothetical protein
VIPKASNDRTSRSEETDGPPANLFRYFSFCQNACRIAVWESRQNSLYTSVGVHYGFFGWSCPRCGQAVNLEADRCPHCSTFISAYSAGIAFCHFIQSVIYALPNFSRGLMGYPRIRTRVQVPYTRSKLSAGSNTQVLMGNSIIFRHIRRLIETP